MLARRARAYQSPTRVPDRGHETCNPNIVADLPASAGITQPTRGQFIYLLECRRLRRSARDDFHRHRQSQIG